MRIIVASNTASSTFTMIGYVATTSTIVAGDEITRTSSAGATANQVYSITFPVKKGDYWKVDSTSGISNLKFTSVGS